MKIARPIWIAIILLVLWLALTWQLGAWIGLKPPVLYYLRGGLWFIGLAGFAGFLLLRPKDASAGAGPGSDTLSEIDLNFAEAAKRVLAGRGVKQLAALPTVFVLGDSSAAKTSLIAQAGVEAELLAGQAFDDNAIKPTRSVNLWFGQQTLFVDPSGALLEDVTARKRLFKKFAPVQVNSLLAAKTPAARSVVFAVDCDAFFQPGGAEAMAAKARSYQTVLGELSQEIGSSFPVYVVFTKADRITYFREFVENLGDAEAAAVLGVTLPMRAGLAQGGYAEQQTKVLSDAFQNLYCTLADRRNVYLGREHNAANLPNIYEFPREFAKLRPLLVQFVVDLCRPSQLGTSPFARGFYFTGVRPVTVNDVAQAVQMPAAEEQGFDAGATRMFNRPLKSVPMAGEVRQATSRKVPQWVYLRRLFPDVILADRQAGMAGASNVKINSARRWLLGTAAAAALLLATWWTVSYLNNRALIEGALADVQAMPAAGLASGQLALPETLRHLTGLKGTLATLNDFSRNGTPFKYGGLLYSGEAIREPLTTAYYAFFRRILLAPTQETLVQICSRPEAADALGYRYVYEALKSYLITSSHHEKSTGEFLTPALLLHWKKDQPVDNERLDLARQNFDFYAQELPANNPYPRFATPDSTAVQNARAYLLRFGQQDFIYQAMLTAAGAGRKMMVFNQDFPGTSETVINSFKVEPGFSKDGFNAFQKQLADPDKYFSGEEWVLGPTSAAGLDKTKLVDTLRVRYHNDFVKTWQDYLKATTVVAYGGLPDAVTKLDKLGSPQSSLLEALCVASENTSVPAKDIAAAFQPVQFVTPAGCLQKLVGSSNGPYMNQLIGLQGALKMVGPIDKADPNAIGAANASAGQAEGGARTLSLNFTPDPNDPKSPVLSKTAQLLLDPITRVPGLLTHFGGGPANQGAAGLCASIAPMLAKYPFNPRSTADATLQEVNDFLKPQEGRLWQLYNGPLKQYLIPAGDGFVAAPEQQNAATPAFINFFNRAVRMSRALYKGDNPQNPSLSFSMQPTPSPDVNHVTLNIDGQTLSTDLTGGAKSQVFAWPGTATGVSLQVRFGSGGGPDFTLVQTSGLWAVWHFLDTAEHVPGSATEMQWVQKTAAGVVMISGHPAAVRFTLDSQVLRPLYFSGMTCVSKAVQ
jgi:type VI secretion system protein ImpL